MATRARTLRVRLLGRNFKKDNNFFFFGGGQKNLLSDFAAMVEYGMCYECMSCNKTISDQ